MRTGNTLPLGSRGHIYVTRSATRDYQTLAMPGTYGVPEENLFESARRTLTEHLLSAIPDPAVPGTYTVPIKGNFDLTIRAFVVKDGPFLVVKKIREVRGALRGSAEQGNTSAPALRRSG